MIAFTALDPIGNRNVDEEATLAFTATATDADLPAETLTFSLANGTAGSVPAGAAITAVGVFTWTPTEAQGPNTYTFDVVVTDSGVGTLSDSETITAEFNTIIPEMICKRDRCKILNCIHRIFGNMPGIHCINAGTNKRMINLFEYPQDFF